MALRVLYIGGTGEISYSCVHESVRLGHEVTVFNRGRGDEPLPGAIEQLTGDLADDTAYTALADRRFDAVCQFIAFTPAAVRRDVATFSGECGQYVFISSASAYQKPPERVVITEDVPLVNPYWAYSRAKAEMEALLMEAHAAGDLPVTVVRPSHTFRRKFPGGIADGDDWAWRIRQGKPVVVHGDGTSLWTYTHSDDFAKPFARLLGNDAALGEAFHITRHMESFTWDTIFQTIGRVLDTETRIVHVPTDTLVRFNGDWEGPLRGDKMWPVLFDNTKVMRVAGDFTCDVGLEDGLARVAEHYRQRAGATTPDAELHAMVDRVCAAQEAVGA